MKKLIPFLIGMIFLSVTSYAQSSTRYNSRNNDEHVAQVRTTADATPTYIDSVKLSTNETGLVELYVIGYQKDTAYSVRGKISVDFNKRRGSLSIGTITTNIPIVADAALGSSTFTMVSVNNNIYVQVTGKAATSIRWYSILKAKSQATVL
jgi:hypothetical protein